MKYLLLFLSINAFADFKIDIVNHEGQSMSKEFKTESEADTYILNTKHRWGTEDPKNYSVTKTDITAAKTFAVIEQVALAKMSCARLVKAHVGALNLVNGKTQEQITAIMTTYKDVISLLDAGALDTALALITSLTTTAEIDQSYKDSVIAKINSCNVSM